MLLKKLSLVTLACLFASGCIITSDSDDDETSSDTEVTASATTPTTDTPTTDTATTDTATTDGTSSGGDTDATTGDPGAAGCGWGPISGNEDVPNGYQCGIEGEDPDGTHPIECSPNAIFEVGLDCTAAGITGEGCCDENGDVWYCADDGNGPIVFNDDCADPTGTDTHTPDTDTDTDTDTATDSATDTDTATDGATDSATDTDPTTGGK